MTTDIDLSDVCGAGKDSWTPIGRYIDSNDLDNRAFSGTFDGDGHIVTGLYINAPNDNNSQGLFGYVRDGTVQNLGVVDGFVAGGNYVGGVVGVVRIQGSTVTNCYNTGTVEGAKGSVGGVVGSNAETKLENCYNTGTVEGSGTNSNVGGVVGVNGTSGNKGTVTNCYNTGTVTGRGNLGGVVGDNFHTDSKVANCYNTGTVTGGNSAGGVVGNNASRYEVTNCYYLESETIFINTEQQSQAQTMY